MGQNHEVTLPDMGEEGLNLALKLNPDIILLDLGLADITAETIAEKLCMDE